jgi:hypothetical protein
MCARLNTLRDGRRRLVDKGFTSIDSMERKAIMYLDRGLVGCDAFYGFISFGARLFRSRDWDRGRAADDHNRISCYSQPAGNYKR